MKFNKKGEYIEARVSDNLLYRTLSDGTGLIRVEEGLKDGNKTIERWNVIYRSDEIDFRGIIHYKKKFRNAIDKYMEGET